MVLSVRQSNRDWKEGLLLGSGSQDATMISRYLVGTLDGMAALYPSCVDYNLVSSHEIRRRLYHIRKFEGLNVSKCLFSCNQLVHDNCERVNVSGVRIVFSDKH